jgi:hypothetical protein
MEGVAKSLAGAVAILCCALRPSPLAGGEGQPLMLISLPEEGQVCVMPADFPVPYTQRGVQERIRTRRHLYRENLEGGVLLREDQVIGFSIEGSGDLKFLEKVPAGRLRDLTLIAPHITDEGIKQLRRCDGLTHLSLGLDRIDNLDKVLAATPRLIQVDLETPGIPAPLNDKHFFTDKRFELFLSLRDLRSVRIGSPLLGDEALRLAAKLPKLEVLEIRVETPDIRERRKITDEGLKALAAARHLREIVLQVGPRCTDDGVKELLKLDHLEWIEIQGMEKVASSTVEALKNKFPDAHIKFPPRASP